MFGPAQCVLLKSLKFKYRSGHKHKWKPSAIGNKLTLMPAQEVPRSQGSDRIPAVQGCSALTSCQVPGTVCRQYVLSNEHCSHSSVTV